MPSFWVGVARCLVIWLGVYFIPTRSRLLCPQAACPLLDQSLGAASVAFFELTLFSSFIINENGTRFFTIRFSNIEGKFPTVFLGVPVGLPHFYNFQHRRQGAKDFDQFTKLVIQIKLIFLQFPMT